MFEKKEKEVALTENGPGRTSKISMAKVPIVEFSPVE